MSEFKLPLAPRDQGWIELRERLARAAREMHFFAVSSEAGNGAALLAIAGNLAGLAMSIPLSPTPSSGGGCVKPSTLCATQILQNGREGGDERPIIIEGVFEEANQWSGALPVGGALMRDLAER
jgi:hypothetical protein